MPRSQTEAGTTRWARTAARVTSKEWRDDNLAGILWYLGVFVVLGVLADVVRVVAK
jgi:hypothetical protein